MIDLCDDDGVLIVCTDVAMSTRIARDYYEASSELVCIENRGHMAARLRCGDANSVAGELCITLPPRTRETFRKRQGATHLSAVCEPGCATTLVAWCIGGAL